MAARALRVLRQLGNRLLELAGPGRVLQAFDHCYHQACDDITNLDLAGYETLADGVAHVLALLAEDPDLRDSLGGGATAATAAKKSLTAAQKRRLKARTAKMAEYRGSKLAR